MTVKRRVLKDDRSTVTQLLAAAETDSDGVSVFMAGCTVADTEAAIFVVKGRERIAYLRALCERQGFLTDKPVVGVKKRNDDRDDIDTYGPSA
jgi:thiamine biosynthesis lipoprotein ApbE